MSMGSPRQATLAQRSVDRRRYSRLALFSEPSYTTIGDPYTDGRSVAGPPAGVIGSVTCKSENKSTFFPPRLCWGVRAFLFVAPSSRRPCLSSLQLRPTSHATALPYVRRGPRPARRPLASPGFPWMTGST
jgi:hypothetical protein